MPSNLVKTVVFPLEFAVITPSPGQNLMSKTLISNKISVNQMTFPSV